MRGGLQLSHVQIIRSVQNQKMHSFSIRQHDIPIIKYNPTIAYLVWNQQLHIKDYDEGHSGY